MNAFPPFLSGQLTILWIYLVALLTAIVHVGFAFAVASDSGLLWRHFRRNTFLVSGWLWALATLLGGVFVAGVYWLVHHSTLRPRLQSERSMAPQEPYVQ